MSKLKKFLIVFLSFMPLSAGAIIPYIIAGGVAAIAGFSIWRSIAPVDMNDALQFFSSCWTCQMFSAVMSTLSNILPRIYESIGTVVIPMAIALTFVYFTWTLASGFLNSKIENGWTVSSKFGLHMIKLAIVCALLAFPLPRLISSTIIEPIFNIGLSVNHIIGDTDTFGECMIATTLMDTNNDRASMRADGMPTGAFPVKMRSGLACELANVHRLTGTGMTIGWTMMNMAFNAEYMHKIIFDIPIFPNVILICAGLLIFVLYFMALLPIPIYFLEVFVTLALDFVMLPLMLLSWLFGKDWKIFPDGGKSIKDIINDVIRSTVGIAMTVVFLIFGIMFLDAIAGSIGGMSHISQAFELNDSTILMDGLMFQNNGLITVIVMGAFFAMFMNSIPALIKTLFDIKVSDKFYNAAKKDFETTRALLGKWWKTLKN